MKRVARLRAGRPSGCAACIAWPLVFLMGDGDPEPEVICQLCGTSYAERTRVRLIGVNLADL